MTREKDAVASAAICILSFFFMLIISGFSNQSFLADDNRTQWYPVIEKAYEQLFTEGSLPAYNFYLAKGLPVAEPGYYGILNPFILISYLIAGIFPGALNTLSVYIAVMTALGAVMVYKVCRLLDVGILCSTASAAAMLSCGAYVSFFYWYYIFNNIFFVPLLIWAYLRFRNTKAEFFACGVVLAADIFCGNVQYTFYHYLIYCVISVIMILARKKNSFKAAVSNIGIGIVLSVPVFAMLINASADFGGDGFMTYPIHFGEFAANMLVPEGIVSQLSADGLNHKAGVMSRNDLFICYSAALILPIIICCVPHIINTFKTIRAQGRDSYFNSLPGRIKLFFTNERNTLIFAAAAALIVLMNICDGSIVALILSVLPVVNHFRYLFKVLFAAIPIMAVLTALLIEHSKGRLKKAVLGICCACTLVGFVNNFFVYKEVGSYFTPDSQVSVSEEKEYADKLISDNDIDLKNYRSICLYGNGALTKSKFDYSKNLTRNFPAYTESFTLSAYEISLSDDILKQFDMIYEPDGFLTKYANAGTVGYLYDNLSSAPAETEKQLVNNGVRYIFVQKQLLDEEIIIQNTVLNPNYIKTLDDYQYYTQKLCDRLNTLESISVEKVISLDNNYDIIVLAGVNSICTDSAGNHVNLRDDRMNLLSFEADGSDSYTLQMSYNDKLYARFDDNSGNTRTLALDPDENGNVCISASGCNNGRIYIGYSSTMFTVGIICEIISYSGLILIIVLALTGKRCLAGKSGITPNQERKTEE